MEVQQGRTLAATARVLTPMVKSSRMCAACAVVMRIRGRRRARDAQVDAITAENTELHGQS